MREYQHAPTTVPDWGSGFGRALATQGRVIGALIIRELHTRFGRDNIGYLWFIGEPMLLAVAVTLLHSGAAGAQTSAIMPPVPFWLGGYTMFLVFRGVVNRSESAVESNRTLLYHRQVTMLDILLARTLLEGAASLSALIVMLGGAWMLGYGGLPGRPLLVLAAYALLLWFSFGLALIVSAASEYSHAVGRFVHPATYIAMPLSGAFFIVEWLPQGVRDALFWNPLITMFQLLRMGQFSDFDSKYIDVPYVVAWCMPLTLIGLLMLCKARRRMHLE